MPAKANTTVVHRNRDAMKNIPGGCITIHFVEVRTAAINMRISAGLTRDDKSERPSRKQTLVGDTRDEAREASATQADLGVVSPRDNMGRQGPGCHTKYTLAYQHG